jgi:hypothetical protein
MRHNQPRFWLTSHTKWIRISLVVCALVAMGLVAKNQSIGSAGMSYFEHTVLALLGRRLWWAYQVEQGRHRLYGAGHCQVHQAVNGLVGEQRGAVYRTLRRLWPGHIAEHANAGDLRRLLP